MKLLLAATIAAAGFLSTFTACTNGVAEPRPVHRKAVPRGFTQEEDEGSALERQYGER